MFEKILILCTGNICRSPLAEELIRQRALAAGKQVLVRSAGIGALAGHSADTSRTADLVMAAFATLDFPLTEVEVFHTDRGSEFDNAKIDELLDVFDIRGSPSGKGDPYDNAVVESTNRLLKKELIYRNHYTSLEQLRSDLNDYVWWSDNQRLHSTLGYRSPKEFTEQGLVL